MRALDRRFFVFHLIHPVKFTLFQTCDHRHKRKQKNSRLQNKRYVYHQRKINLFCFMRKNNSSRHRACRSAENGKSEKRLFLYPRFTRERKFFVYAVKENKNIKITAFYKNSDIISRNVPIIDIEKTLTDMAGELTHE